MNFRIESRVGVRASAETIWELIADLPGWSRWNPVETEVSGVIGYGGSIALTERIPGLVERQVTAKVGEWQPLGQLVWLEKRGFQFGMVRYYEIEELDAGSCIVANGAIFSGFFGEGFHDKHKARLRAAYAQIAEALKAQTEGSQTA